jgi:hypothetical protein
MRQPLLEGAAREGDDDDRTPDAEEGRAAPVAPREVSESRKTGHGGAVQRVQLSEGGSPPSEVRSGRDTVSADEGSSGGRAEEMIGDDLGAAGSLRRDCVSKSLSYAEAEEGRAALEKRFSARLKYYRSLSR